MIIQAFRVISCSPSSDCAGKKIGRVTFTFVPPSRPFAAAARKDAIKIPNRCSSIWRAIFFSKFSNAGSMKSGELEVTEMLPDADHLLWKERDGRRTFELRTLIVPRA